MAFLLVTLPHPAFRVHVASGPKGDGTQPAHKHDETAS